MKAKDFDAIVVARANERVQNKIKIFRGNIIKALITLGGSVLYNSCSQQVSKVGELALACTREHSSQEWPLELREMEEAAVRKELLSTLDEMQRALLAANKPRDLNEEGFPSPISEEPEHGTFVVSDEHLSSHSDIQSSRRRQIEEQPF